MKKLLYIGRPNLGENLFATPCLELLSKEYEIVLLVLEKTIPAYTNYNFIKHVLPGPVACNSDSKIPVSTYNFIINFFKPTDDSYYAYHHDHDIAFLNSYPELLKIIKKYPVLPDEQINTRVSRTRKYMQKLQLMSLEDTNKYDCTIRTPQYESQPVSNSIIIYQGSKEKLRRLSNDIILKFATKLPNATYLVEEKIGCILKEEYKINNLYIKRDTQESLKEIIRLFQSKPKVMIGPDSGLTQLAISYKISQIWLESRIRPEEVIDYQYKDFIKVYRRKKVSCLQDCYSRIALVERGPDMLTYLPINNNKQHTPWFKLQCRDKLVSCLDYSDKEIDEILFLINE